MFVGFIAVVVILLIIVGLMSTGATSGSGGVDQTKATKAISEISALAQSTGFYKTTVDTSNYKDLTTDALVNAGIVAKADTIDTTVASDYKLDGDSTIVDNDTVVVSKAVPGVIYKVYADPTLGDNYFDVDIAAGKTLTAGLRQALDTTYAKLHANVDGDAGTGENDGATANDGLDDNGVKSGVAGDDYHDSDNTDGAEVVVFN